jgi:hypothetical protein
MDSHAEAAREAGRRMLPRAFWIAGVVLSLALVWLARYRPSWPWFSLWVLALLGLLAVLSLPAVRRGLNLSWFGVTLLILTGTGLFDLYLFHVETHRQRSERLEIQGVYFGPDQQPIRVGVGRDDLDVRLEGSLYDFDRWSLEVRRLDARRFALERPRHVDMLRVRGPEGWTLGTPGTRPVLGAPLDGRTPAVTWTTGPAGDTSRLELLREGPRGTLVWGRGRARLSSNDPIVDRRLARRLSQGVPLAELDWDTLPNPAAASDLVLTRTRRGRTLGRLLVALPRYRVVSRTDGDLQTDAAPTVMAAGDTVWVTSRGKTWAFALDVAPGVSRVSAPTAVRFVRRPRPTGWALPSPEACGSSADRCAVISTRPLPPPQPHFDLSGFGLDTTRYSVLARLEADGDGVRVVSDRNAVRVGYEEVHALPALGAGGDEASTGVLLAVSREAQGRQSAVLLTVVTLYFLIVGALLVLSGDARLWARRKEETPNVTAAWAFLNVFLVFLGVRLALGLRVAYTPPFYDRAAVTGVGLWITFATMLVALGRWSAWVPAFWRLAARVERPISSLFLPGRNGHRRVGSFVLSDALSEKTDHAGLGQERVDTSFGKRTRRARVRTLLGLGVFLTSLGLILWQRPEAAAGLLVSAVGVSAWLAMGVTRLGVSGKMSGSPVGVITTHGDEGSPLASFAAAAGASVVLVLAIHAPELALVPVLVLLGLFGLNHAVGWTTWSAHPARRGWVLFVALLALAALAAVAFSPWPTESLAALAGGAIALTSWLARSSQGDEEPRVARHFRAFTDLGHVLFSGVGWMGVVLILGALVFLNAQEIPPFVRFALVFTLFLLAIRAGLALRRVLEAPSVPERSWGHLEALGLLVIPLAVLLVFMLFDFGLGLVFFAPMFVTVLLAARIDRLPPPLAAASLAVVAGVTLLAWSVLKPSLGELRSAPTVPAYSRAYASVGNGLIDGLRGVGLSGPITRATVRSIAATDPGLLEEALALAGPSEALMVAAPSREQVWGGRAYASSGWTGTGFAGTTLLGRGVPTAVSYAENTFAVYILAEHGALGGLSVLLVYLSLLVIVAIWVFRVRETIQESPTGRVVLAMTVGGVLWLTIPAVYVAASNLALVPLTGQNMPFLGLNSWADVVLVCGLATGMVVALAKHECPSRAAQAREGG